MSDHYDHRYSILKFHCLQQFQYPPHHTIPPVQVHDSHRLMFSIDREPPEAAVLCRPDAESAARRGARHSAPPVAELSPISGRTARAAQWRVARLCFVNEQHAVIAGECGEPSFSVHDGSHRLPDDAPFRYVLSSLKMRSQDGRFFVCPSFRMPYAAQAPASWETVTLTSAAVTSIPDKPDEKGHISTPLLRHSDRDHHHYWELWNRPFPGFHSAIREQQTRFSGATRGPLSSVMGRTLSRRPVVYEASAWAIGPRPITRCGQYCRSLAGCPGWRALGIINTISPGQHWTALHW